MNYGLIIESPKPTDYVFGGAVQLKGEVLQPDADWSGFLPEPEIQDKNGVETNACVTFTTNNCIEILEKHEFGARDNWSDRFLATMAGTKERGGNTPANVAETRRKRGNVKEEEWPFEATSFNDYYKDIPDNVKTMAIGEGAQYAFGYEAVRSTAQDLMQALKYSPVGMSTYAWVKDENGVYYRPQGLSDNHFVTLFGYVEGKFWRVFDSYTNDGVIIKNIRWDCLPMMAMRYTLNKEVVSQSLFDKFISLLKQILGL